MTDVPPPQPVARPRPAAPSAESVGDRPLTTAQVIPTRARPEKRSGTSRAAWAAAAAAIIVLVVATVAVLRALAPSSTTSGTGVVLPSGTLVLDAVPWAEVVEIVDAEGQTMPLPDDSFTPLHLSLPEGRYRVSLRRPEGADPLTIEAEISSGETARRLERFDTLDAAAFLEKYGL